MIKIIFPIIFFCCLLALPGRAQPASCIFNGKGVRVQLVSDASKIQAGQTFHLGLWLQHEPGYHTYWQNPGLAGIATNLKPELPPGFTTGAMIYPPPDKVKMASLNVHGFERDILVALPITAPSPLPAGDLTIPVQASWMCCQRTCNPGLAQLSIRLATGEKSTPDAAWLPKLQALLAAQPPVISGWTLKATRFEKEIELMAEPPPDLPLPEGPQFFSSDNLICSHPLQDWQKSGTGYRVRLSLSEFPPDDQSHLRGLLFGKGSWLPKQNAPYCSIAVPVKNDSAASPATR